MSRAARCHRLAIAGGGLTRGGADLWRVACRTCAWQAIRRRWCSASKGFEDYVEHAPFFGAIVGRCANRIAGGRFTIDGERFQAETNDGHNTLHGGSRGWWRRVWTLAERGDDFVTLTLHDADGVDGLSRRGRRRLHLSARSRPARSRSRSRRAATAPTLVNAAHHSYFNLDDGGLTDILDHRLMLPAAAYLPVDGQSIPTGIVQPVEGTPFDFRVARPIRMQEQGGQVRLRPEFLPRRRARAAAPFTPGRKDRALAWRWKSGRPNQACSFMPVTSCAVARRPRRQALWPFDRLLHGASGLARFAQSPLFPASGSETGRDLPAADRIPLSAGLSGRLSQQTPRAGRRTAPARRAPAPSRRRRGGRAGPLPQDCRRRAAPPDSRR